MTNREARGCGRQRLTFLRPAVTEEMLVTRAIGSMKPRNVHLRAAVALTIAATLAGMIRIGLGRREIARLEVDARTLRLSERAYRQITKSSGRYYTIVDDLSSHGAKSLPGERLLRVEMADESRATSVVLTWRPETGDLIEVNNAVPELNKTEGDVLTDLQAARRSLHWLRALGFSAISPVWRLARESHHSGQNTYVVRWVSLTSEATIVMRDRTGELCTARIGPIEAPAHETAP
jgi:hypothetical protein